MYKEENLGAFLIFCILVFEFIHSHSRCGEKRQVPHCLAGTRVCLVFLGLRLVKAVGNVDENARGLFDIFGLAHWDDVAFLGYAALEHGRGGHIEAVNRLHGELGLCERVERVMHGGVRAGRAVNFSIGFAIFYWGGEDGKKLKCKC